MGLRKIAFWVGLFSLLVGLITYDSEIVTAPVPVITGIVVIVLAVADLIPEWKVCGSCQRKNPKKADYCRYCGADLRGGK